MTRPRDSGVSFPDSVGRFLKPLSWRKSTVGHDRRRRGSILGLLVFLAIVVAAIALVVRKHHEAAAEMPPEVFPIQVEGRRLALSPVTLTLSATIDVLAVRDSVIASRLSAFVVSVPYYEGEHFRKGDILMRLDLTEAQADLRKAGASLIQSRLQDASLLADLAAADANLKMEQAHAERYESLYKVDVVPLEQLEIARSNVVTAQAKLAAARTAVRGYKAVLASNDAAAVAARENLGYGLIAAPFDGIVSQRLVQPGDLVTPGKPLLGIVDPSAGVRLVVSVPTSLAPTRLDVDGQSLNLIPWPAANPQGLRRFEARSDARFALGSRVEGRIEIFASDAAILVPRECLTRDDGDTATLEVIGKEGHVEPIRVKLTAHGNEGAVTRDATFDREEVICGSPDILTRIRGGAPFRVSAERR